MKDPSGITYRNADLSRTRPFKWVWAERVLLGAINLLAGEEGVGKGTLVAWVMARITRGELPGSFLGKPRYVAVIGDEDDWQNVWVPRLHAAGADLGYVLYIDSGPSGTLDIKKDATALLSFVKRHKIVLVYFDQLLDNLGVVNTWKDKQVRDALAPIRPVVQAGEFAVLASLHPNKRAGSFRQRLAGTPAFIALSRSSLLVAVHPQDNLRRIAVRPKGNYSVEPPAFEFVIEPFVFEVPPEPKRRRRIEIEVSRIANIRETNLTAFDVLDAKPSRQREDSQAGIARALLSKMFADGERRRVVDVYEELGPYKLRGNTLSTAAKAIGLHKYQEGFPTTWWWDPHPNEATGATGN
jgi:hypothetical protein